MDYTQAVEKYRRILMVIPLADRSAFVKHPEGTLCVGCLSTFVEGYMADIPDVFEFEDEDDDEVSGI